MEGKQREDHGLGSEDFRPMKLSLLHPNAHTSDARTIGMLKARVSLSLPCIHIFHSRRSFDWTRAESA